MSIEITGKNKWRFSIVSAPEFGHASISIDGVQTYDGRVTANDHAFEIADAKRNIILTSAPEFAGRWQRFFGQGSHVVRSAVGAELARITYRGFFGFRRALVIDGQPFACPRRQRIEFPGAIIRFDARLRAARVEVSDQPHQLAYLGVGFYLWLREDTMS